MFIYHNSREERCRTPFGARPAGARVILHLYTGPDISRAFVRCWFEDSEHIFSMMREDAGFSTALTMPERPGLFWYYFIAEHADGRRIYYGNASDDLGGEGACSDREPPSFQITVYDPDYRTPEWMHGAPMYQIFPDRFASSGRKDASLLAPGCRYHEKWDEEPDLKIVAGDNAADDFFGGDLRGIREKLPYLHSLGIRCIYLNPVFRARSNHKYDTCDYRSVDPSFGTAEDLRSLFKAARAQGIRILLDGVFSHTGADSVYFDRDDRFGQGAYHHPDSPYFSWYRFRHYPDDYECWWDFPTLPDVNENDPSYRRFMLEDADAVVPHYIREGAGGWRLDVADELPVEFLRALRVSAKHADPDAAVIGEVWEDASRKVSYNELRCYCAGDMLDGCMNYPVRDAVLDFFLGRRDAAAVCRILDSQRENYPPQFLYSCMNLLGSHDKPRAITVLSGMPDPEPPREERRAVTLTPGQYRRGVRRYCAAFAMLAALPGMPCIYYGDEAGMTGMADPYCRAPFPWGREDKALQEAIRAILAERPAVCETGFCTLTPLGTDQICIERYTRDGLDAFGHTVRGAQRAMILINRAEVAASVTLHGLHMEAPALSAKQYLF